MARPLRIEYSGAVYHVMARGDGGKFIFNDDSDALLFLKWLGEICESHGWNEQFPALTEGISNTTESELHLYDGGYVLIPITGENGTPTIQVMSFERLDTTAKRFWPSQPE